MEIWCPRAFLLPSTIVVFFFVFVPQILIQFTYASVEEYNRPPPGNIIFSKHKRSESEPQQVHISLAGSNHMRVTWVTEDHRAHSTVEYGTAPGQYTTRIRGEHTSYTYFFYSSGKIHHVKIGPLEPDTTYYYRCGASGPEFSFKMPPSTFPIEFAVVGDLGQTDWTNSTLEHVESKDYDVFLLPGDLSYANGQQPLWDSFGRLVEPTASRRPWMVTEGNHEIEIVPIIYTHGFKAYNARWLMPYEESGSESNLYYSFDVAGRSIHIIMLGSYTEFNFDSAQFKWLQQDLAKIDRRATPWVFVLLHAPWYNTNKAHQGEGESMRKVMEELLYGARVDIVFAGHVHAYERFTRIYDNEADTCGPVYVTIGDGGNREGLAMSYKEPASPLSMFREASFGHGRLRVLNHTHAHWSWHRNNETNSVIADEVWLESLSASSTCMGQQPSSIKDEL
ncbi:purple acid phosphatase 22-like [Syzygium oleosum]|uniref:purple acid phosphatase 22-like n=1 Tax=Syzygium oleosum TaxID=219896 RepID=UPI0011D293A5|nr:purple acid phosphatase 22-like [Syzygium oleosum]